MKLPELDLDFAAGRDEALAITCEGEQLSYADLKRRAAAITAWLVASACGAAIASAPCSPTGPT